VLLIAAQQRGRTIRYDAIGVGDYAVDAGGPAPTIYGKRPGNKQ
jgi:hypothetical protein